MRGKLMKRFSAEEHRNILGDYADDQKAADIYTELERGDVSRQLVRYWRTIFREGSKAKADRFIADQRRFIKPSPDDDIGSDLPGDQEFDRILVIPDIHAPYQHPDTLNFLRYVKAKFCPDLVVNLGDETDGHAISFHESDPNLDSAGAELEKAKSFLGKLEQEFPRMLVCQSNHGSLLYRRAKVHGIPAQMIKSYRDVLFPNTGAPGWSWAYAWRIKTKLGPVVFKHQSSSSVLGDAAHEGANLFVGHQHGLFQIQYAASSDRLYWGATCGCLIDKDSLAFAYGKNSKNKPIIGCGIIIKGVPQLLPMLLNEDGRWIGK